LFGAQQIVPRARANAREAGVAGSFCERNAAPPNASEACPNSHQAAAALARLGYRDVRVYAAGKLDWQSNLPMEQ
jgi:hypothetical protein